MRTAKTDQTGHQTGGCPGGSSESTLGALHFVGFVVRQLNFSANIDAWGVHFYEKIDSSESKKQACLEGIYDCGTSITPSSFCFFFLVFFCLKWGPKRCSNLQTWATTNPQPGSLQERYQIRHKLKNSIQRMTEQVREKTNPRLFHPFLRSVQQQRLFTVLDFQIVWLPEVKTHFSQWWGNLLLPYVNNKGADLRICAVWPAPLLFVAWIVQ